MNQQVKKFYDAMTADDALRAKADKINQKFAGKKPSDAEATEAVVAFAADQGYSFTKGDLEAYGEELKKDGFQTVSEDELAAVAGGAGTEGNSGTCVRCFRQNNLNLGGHDCFCIAGGGGQHHEPDYTCVCVIGGGGGKCSKGGRLFCPVVGGITFNPI